MTRSRWTSPGSRRSAARTRRSPAPRPSSTCNATAPWRRRNARLCDSTAQWPTLGEHPLVTCDGNSVCFGQTVSQRDYVKRKLVVALKGMGFEAVSLVDLSEDYLRVKVSWAIAGQRDVRLAQKHDLGSHMIICNMCSKESVSMCISPCSHMICVDCAVKEFTTCPFCRGTIDAFETL
mmetsp:Transcript_80864/g.261863  ORF Transcript_80864/g.261863 Transcript_80864/m.261863 type:complete len:178 (+) Transcript_80864:164-697(+)